MAGFSLIEGSARDDMVELRNRLVVSIPNDGLWWMGEGSPFINDDWKAVLVPWGFYGATRINAGRESGPSLVDGGWPSREGLPEISAFVDPLIWCLEARGCQEIIITNDRGVQPEDHNNGNEVPPLYFRVKLDARAMARVCVECDLVNPGLYSFKVLVFDATGEWASCDYFDDDHLIGGTSEFIEQYYAAAGGEEYVRAWYYHYNLKNDYVGPGRYGSPEDFYSVTGWPPPIYPESRFVLRHQDIDWTPMFGDRIKSCGPGPSDAEVSAYLEKKREAEQSGDD